MLIILIYFKFVEKEENLSNVSNGALEDGWVSPSKLVPNSPKGDGHSREGSNASTSSMKQKKWIDIVTGRCIF
jgi:hypothetical protein